MMARFIPFVRSYAPFAAGAGHRKKRNFMFYNVVGGFIWIGLLLGIGYGTGNLISYTVDLF